MIEGWLAEGKRLAVDYRQGWNNLGITWFDHRFDWGDGPENWGWAERGIFGSRYIEQGDLVLDLGSGDGMFDGLFFAKKAGMVHGMDRDPKAIEFARQHYGRANVEFFQGDFAKGSWPLPNYDVVMWFGSLAEQTHRDCGMVMGRVAGALRNSKNGSLVGTTLLRCGLHPARKWAFQSVDQVQEFLGRYFSDVECWTTVWSEIRTDVFFRARSRLKGV